MVWLRWYLIGLLLGVAGIGLWWQLHRGSTGVFVDLVRQFDAATLRRPSPEVFAVREVTISGVSKASLAVQQPSRIAWDLTLPDHAWVETELALEEAAWTMAGDGVLFRVGVSLGGRYDEPVSQVINPFERPEDRRWVRVAVDLSPYAGRAVSLIFNTGAGLTGNNRNNDLAVWGAPRVVTR